MTHIFRISYFPLIKNYLCFGQDFQGVNLLGFPLNDFVNLPEGTFRHFLHHVESIFEATAGNWELG